MATSTDFLQEYQQTEEAYCQGNYEQAAALVYQLVEDYPEDPSARLLCGHIYGYGLQQYDVAREQYVAVINLTHDSELLEQAHQALADTDQYLIESPPGSFEDSLDSPEIFNALVNEEIEGEEMDLTQDLDWLSEETNGSSNGTSSIPNLDLESADTHGLNGSSTEETLMDFNDLQDDNFDFQDLDDADLDLSTSDLDASIGLGFNNLEDEPDYVKSNGSQSPLSFTEDNPFASGGDLEEGTEILNPLDPENSFTELEADPFTLEEDESLSVPNFATDESSTSDIEQLSGDLFSPEDELDWLDFPTENPEDESDSVHSPETLNGSSPDYLSQPTQFLEFDSFDDDELGGLNNPEAYESHPADQRELNGANHESSSPSRAVGTASSSFEAELDDIFAPLEDAADSDGSLSPDEHPPQNGFVSVKETSPFQEDEFDPDLDSAFSFSDELFVNDADDSVSLPPNTTNMKANYKVLDAEESNEEETLLTNNNAVNDSYLSDPDDSGPSRSVNGAFSSNYADAEEDEEPDDLVFDSADIPNSFDLDPDEDTFGNSFDVTVEANDTNGRSQNGKVVAQTPNDFLEDFEEFDDIGDFVITDSGDNDLYVDSDFSSVDSKFGNTTNNSTLDSDSSAIQDDEIFNTAYAASAVTTLSPDLGEGIDTMVTTEQGVFSFLENASLKRKPLYMALGTGLATLVLVATATNISTRTASLNDKSEVVDYLRGTGWLLTAVAGGTSFLATWGLGRISAQQIAKATDDLQAQFDAISKGNLDARATVFAEDDFGKMSSKFNHAAQFIQSITREAQRKAKEQEDARDDLHRQVIRLLDDVEGAARGDLTVTAEVTANVLGAVADSFNLTIQNLREIVVQVKQAARQVSKGATDSATFAKDVAGDAFRQAEELAATLNSVQVLTDAIQRVAESAREAEEVARSAAALATKGGEAVQMTVAGILKIRETVAETSREVKRLGESSQEISKIVGLISQIASRTNLLALNASIEAARAGEAGKGFAIVADEVRQLADKSAKSLKDIEQIVMQIQSQTNTVMMAMSQGHQQVIEGTRLAEQAKRALDDIIQVTNRIDVLVRSITADTVEQNETARAVAQVMRAVEHSAQETSTEAQKVSSALTKLVGVARDLLTSVERFRVDSSEKA
ncbi:Putative methyl-accepting chemotaxis protein sll0041 [Planktothrix agardhii]|jgi:twitching motility protein PilJ|uniref:Chemotaxis sensory transducer n=1 Tax=Planktothrix agardhii TaxID=1160 RepID=A0A1J1JBA8_PLAAG|nr:methyl-accepting chemotaxis protein [Planktothrix agardhii]MBG0745938.1 methyl-accepting chemotaxis protein [Planktothrix agardhii KL2]MCB8750955.1 methyl-accepting chemotaxis protein [Planktothrix agardhii 1810]MCF3580777.1 methyl-accepting chemotaxis protein [Planktothrix agardhii 1811]MCF3589549.1 methyl-accepting chemotaxis protein [Planktothrix agardhii 1029]MCF3620985.1 methyl-accepting chemotaxis protein [Planktothrix agardhii 1030]